MPGSFDATATGVSVSPRHGAPFTIPWAALLRARRRGALIELTYRPPDGKLRTVKLTAADADAVAVDRTWREHIVATGRETGHLSTLIIPLEPPTAPLGMAAVALLLAIGAATGVARMLQVVAVDPSAPAAEVRAVAALLLLGPGLFAAALGLRAARSARRRRGLLGIAEVRIDPGQIVAVDHDGHTSQCELRPGRDGLEISCERPDGRVTASTHELSHEVVAHPLCQALAPRHHGGAPNVVHRITALRLVAFWGPLSAAAVALIGRSTALLPPQTIVPLAAGIELGMCVMAGLEIMLARALDRLAVRALEEGERVRRDLGW